jgi:hypothetical protein
LPKTITAEVVKWILNRRLVVTHSNHPKIAFEGFDQIRVERDFVLFQQAVVQKVEDGEQKNWFVRSLMRTAPVAPEVVKSLQPLLPCFFRRHWMH